MNAYSLEILPLQPHTTIPNNARLPLLLYRQLYDTADNLQQRFIKNFEEHGWGGSWVNGVYDYHHYHSNAHEVLGICSGHATLMFGGPEGRKLEVKAGDGVVIPAGVGHCCLRASDDFKVVGAYPHGQEDYDICREKDDLREKKKNIEQVALPTADPFKGKNGPLMHQWR